MKPCSVTTVRLSAACATPDGLGSAVDHWLGDLWDTTRSGKGMRSALFDAVYSTGGGNDPAAAAVAAEALEMLHEAFLLHDDLLDGDDHRRGCLNLQGRTRDRVARLGAVPVVAEHVGRAGGLLGGDLLLVGAMSRFARVPVPGPTLHRVLDEVEQAVTVTIAGEFADVHDSAAPHPPDRERALAVGEAKTAAYSVTLPLVLGAILAGLADETVESLREVGRHLGTAYQVVDDLLGVFGDPGVTGKSNTGDLLRHAPTVLLAYAATTEDWPRIEAALDDPPTARELLRRCGARDEALRLVEDLSASAHTALEHPSIPADIRAALGPHLAAALERTR